VLQEPRGSRRESVSAQQPGRFSAFKNTKAADTNVLNQPAAPGETLFRRGRQLVESVVDYNVLRAHSPPAASTDWADDFDDAENVPPAQNAASSGAEAQQPAATAARAPHATVSAAQAVLEQRRKQVAAEAAAAAAAAARAHQTRSTTAAAKPPKLTPDEWLKSALLQLACVVRGTECGECTPNEV
jgi:hypothetical protein